MHTAPAKTAPAKTAPAKTAPAKTAAAGERMVRNLSSGRFPPAEP